MGWRQRVGDLAALLTVFTASPCENHARPERIHVYVETGIPAEKRDSVLAGITRAQQQNPYFHPYIVAVDTITIPAHIYDSLPQEFHVATTPKVHEDRSIILVKDEFFQENSAEIYARMQASVRLWSRSDEPWYVVMPLYGLHVNKTIFLTVPRAQELPLAEHSSFILNHELVHDELPSNQFHERADFLFNGGFDGQNPQKQFGFTPYVLSFFVEKYARHAPVPHHDGVLRSVLRRETHAVALDRNGAATLFLTQGNLAYFAGDMEDARAAFVLAQTTASDTVLQYQAKRSLQYLNYLEKTTSRTGQAR